MQEARREEGEPGGKVANIWKREMEGEKPSTRMKEEEANLWKREVEGDKHSTRRKEGEGEERLNMTVTGAEPSSPSREAARGDLNHEYHCF